jgi:signal transduction histidine kinase
LRGLQPGGTLRQGQAMKRKIIIGLAVYALILLASGAYIADTIRRATDDVDRLITLHRVEILRGHYLLQIKKVQSDLILADTQHSRSPQNVVSDVADMGKLIDTCFECHHPPQATDQLTALKRQTDRYREALTRVAALRLGAGAPAREQEAAFHLGEDLTGQVRDLVDVTASRLAVRTQEAMRDITRTKYVLYALLAIGPLLSAALGYVFISGLVHPVDVLLESTRRIEAGDLDHRVAGLKDEFEELGVSFNEMARSLKDQMHNMQRTEQMVVVGQLAAGLAHEIKNPLAGIKVAMQVLVEEGRLSDEDRGIAKKVAQEVVRLECLMKNFLNFAKPAKPQLVALDVNAVVEMVLAFFSKANAPRLTRPDALRIAKDLQPVPQTMADPMQLQQVLLNLALNAVDAMPNGGTLGVRTSWAAGSGAIAIEVSDTGRGISREHADKLFQPFFTTKAEGTGLGLATSKRLVEQHGGSIEVAANPGGGTVFRIRLPTTTTTAVAA